MTSWLSGFFLYFIAYPWLVAVAGIVAGRYGRWWAGAVVGMAAALMTFGRMPGPAAAFAVVICSVIGLGGSASGWFIRMRMPRPAVLAGTWTVSGLALLYLYSLTNRVHADSDFWFALVLVGVTMVLGGVTAFALPMYSRTHDA